jgi:hypothetical protein
MKSIFTSALIGLSVLGSVAFAAGEGGPRDDGKGASTGPYVQTCVGNGQGQESTVDCGPGVTYSGSSDHNTVWPTAQQAQAHCTYPDMVTYSYDAGRRVYYFRCIGSDNPQTGNGG